MITPKWIEDLAKAERRYRRIMIVKDIMTGIGIVIILFTFIWIVGIIYSLV